MDSGEVRNILNILKTNQKILAAVLRDGEEYVKISFMKLCDMGYNFRYHTHSSIGLYNCSFQFCFERGIYRIDQDWVIVVRDLGDKYLREFSNKLVQEYPAMTYHHTA